MGHWPRFEVRFVDRLRMGHELCHRGRRVGFLNYSDHAAIRFIRQLARARAVSRRLGGTAPPLVRFRDDFRQIVRSRPIIGLMGCLFVQDLEVRRLAIWLLGRCGRCRNVGLIAKFRTHPDRSVRKEVARALRHMNAFRELTEFVASENDPRIRRLATLPPRDSYQRRMGRYLEQDVERVAVGPIPSHSRMPLRFFVSIGSGKPAKTVEFIRRILEDIRRLVRGDAA